MKFINPIDIGIAIIVGFCVIRGFFRGFIKEVFSVLGVLAGLYTAFGYYPLGAKMLAGWIPGVPYLPLISFAGIFIAVFVGASLVGMGIKYLMSLVFLKWVDRCSGILFGGFKGVLISSVLLFAITVFVPRFDGMVKTSKLTPTVSRIFTELVEWIPISMKLKFENKIQEFKKAWKRSA